MPRTKGALIGKIADHPETIHGAGTPYVLLPDSQSLAEA